MAVANPLWGAPRIHGELGKLGLDVSERTVSRLLRRRRRPPSQTWRTFLTNHLTSLVSLDFFTVPTVTRRVLFVLVLLAHHRRRIVHLRITEHPTAAWTAQQLIEAFPEESAPRWLLQDRDAIYGDIFRGRVAGMGIQEVISAPSSPWQNPYVERVIGPFVASVSITSSSSTRGIFGARSLDTSPTVTVHGLISRWRKTRRRLDPSQAVHGR
jgi:putative transposase